MTNKALDLFTAMTLATLFVYLIMAFCCWDWSPAGWNWVARIVACVLWFAFAGIMSSDDKAVAK